MIVNHKQCLLNIHYVLSMFCQKMINYFIKWHNIMIFLSHFLCNGNQGRGAKMKSPTADEINPTAIIDQWLLYLSAR